MNRDFAVVILAAGLGTRMKSRHAKVLHQVGGRTLVELVVDTATRLAPPDLIYVVVGHQAGVVRQTVAASGVRFVEQKEQLGTGHAVLVGRGELDRAASHVLLLYGDCPLVREETLQALMRQHLESGAAATVLTTRLSDPTGYGRILRDQQGRVTGIVEEKAASPPERAIQEINSGIYCFETEPLFQCLAGLRPDNPAAEYYLTDVMACLAGRGLAVGAHAVDDSSEVLGINTRADLAEVDAILRRRTVRDLMLSGVTVQRPETVLVDSGVCIGQDTILEPFVQVLGHSTLGTGCRIRSYSVVSDSFLGDDVVVQPWSWVHDSRVERGAQIGPYARLRGGNYVEQDARIGNFVELKKTRIGKGSKANHLAYLGDSTIGAGVNIGAGTITCNYDGIAKHPTVIEDGVFVGSNNTLVAPLRIGPGAYLAAGSVITADVEPGALAIARGRQTVKPGWALRRKPRS